MPDLVMCIIGMAKTCAHVIAVWKTQDEATHRLKQSKVEEG